MTDLIFDLEATCQEYNKDTSIQIYMYFSLNRGIFSRCCRSKELSDTLKFIMYPYVTVNDLSRFD